MLAPASLLLGLLVVPIILLYMLRLRRRRVTVSSTLLWQRLTREREANAPWQRLRRNLLLFLQLAILASLAFALARPYLPASTIASGNSVVLLDASASMRATDAAAPAGATRFEAAKTEILQQIDGLSGSDRMTLIQVGRAPSVLVPSTNDRKRLRQALELAQPESGSADWRAAFALARGAAQGYRDPKVIIVSDGGLPPDLLPLPAETHLIPVGRVADNLAISALAPRSGENGPILLAQAANYGESAAEALLSVTVDGVLYDSRRISLPPGESADLTWDLPAAAGQIRATLLPDDPEQDFLPLDNNAFAVNQSEGDTRALLLTNGNVFLEKLFAILPGMSTFKASPDGPAVDEPYDLIIYDGVALPSTPPPGDLLIINPQLSPPASGETAEAEWLPITGTFTNTVAVSLDDSSLLQFVDWGNVNVRQAQRVEAPWAEPLIEAAGGPLLLAGERDGRRVAILTFDLHDSDLPLQIAFPVIMANIVTWLNPGQVLQSNGNHAPGEPVELTPGPGTTAVSVVRPDGETWQVTMAAETQQLLFTETESTGIYQVQVEDANGTRAAGSFAVNLFDPGESQIRPAGSIRIGEATVDTNTAAQSAGQEELWPWLALLALLILLVEWWIHHRGIRRPDFKLP
jgi:hypothetical protein